MIRVAVANAQLSTATDCQTPTLVLYSNPALQRPKHKGPKTVWSRGFPDLDDQISRSLS
jgi:hypothetical protein